MKRVYAFTKQAWAQVMSNSKKTKITFKALYLFLNCLLLSTYVHATPKTINIGADPWCPYNCNPEDKHQSIMVDVEGKALT